MLTELTERNTVKGTDGSEVANAKSVETRPQFACRATGEREGKDPPGIEAGVFGATGDSVGEHASLA